MKPKPPAATFAALPRFDQLRDFVRQTLCSHDRVDARQAPFSEAPIKQGGRLKGFYFEVQGPRLLRSHAIWACEEHRILFYDSTGVRFAEVRLTDSPDPHQQAGTASAA